MGYPSLSANSKERILKKEKSAPELVWWHRPALRREKQKNHCKLEASLGYIVRLSPKENRKGLTATWAKKRRKI